MAKKLYPPEGFVPIANIMFVRWEAISSQIRGCKACKVSRDDG